MSHRRPVAATDSALAEAIAFGAAELSLPLQATQVDALVRYLRLVERWNATYNLTAVRDARAMVTQHVLDCLAAAVALVRHRDAAATRRLLDVGSGAGLPGLVFALLLPDLQVTCVDAVGKKAAFITQAVSVLSIGNAVGLHARVETLTGREHDVVASRAFASLARFVAATRHLLADNGEWMALKGKAPRAEIAELTDVQSSIEPVAVPGLAAERCIVWLRPLRASVRTLS